MRGIHLKDIDASEQDLPEYRDGAFHIPENSANPFLDQEMLFLPEAVRDVAHEIRVQLEETLDLLKNALARGEDDSGEDAS
jgi:hypothetical protein